MEKPTSLAILDLKQKIVDDINESKLPIYIIKPIVKEVYDRVIEQDIIQTQKDKEEFEKKGEN